MSKRVTLIWNESKNRWDMSYKGHFIMDFPDCKNMTLFFKPRKGKANEYEIAIKKIKDEAK